MDVICFGLSLPLQDHETLKDCVSVYCEWMTALHPIPRINVPKPIVDDPNIYCRKIVQHFHNLFVPRNGESKYKLHVFLIEAKCRVILEGSYLNIFPPEPAKTTKK